MRTVAVDFDGVIHSYVSGWRSGGEIPDPPVVDRETGANSIDFLRALLADQRFDVCIYSNRSDLPGGIPAMRAYLRKHGLTDVEIGNLRFPTRKPRAHVMIDDRALLFRGEFPTLKEIEEFRPWRQTDK